MATLVIDNHIVGCSPVGTRHPGDWPHKVAMDAQMGAAVSWSDWFDEIVDAITDGDRSERWQALTSLEGLADYLDGQYSIGYDGIAPCPRENCNLSFDW